MNGDELGLLSWCEVSESALRKNLGELRRRVGGAEGTGGVKVGVVVKADAYGHGLVIAAKAFLAGGRRPEDDPPWMIVNGLEEAEALRRADVDTPIYIVGPVAPFMAPRVVASGARLVVYDTELVVALGAAARAAGRVVPVHVKVETGNHRQGLELDEALALGRQIVATEGLCLEGLSTHYADIEDTTDHRFAMGQLERFQRALEAFAQAGLDVPIANCANSAATILWPRTHGGLVRVGIAAYGLWPSHETWAAALALESADRAGRGGFLPELTPALAWRARIAQVKTVPAGAWVGYGRTFRATHATRIAIVPVGYHEGYDRRLSNLAHMIVDGVRAPVRGRVCMNMAMIDVSDIPSARAGSTATLLGADGDERVSAEDLARWMGTINYEVVSRIHPSIQRIAVP